MKKLRLLSALFAIIIGLSITSCGEEEPAAPSVDNNITVNYKVTITPTFDEIKFCDLTFTYINGEGKTVSEPVKGHFEKLISYTKFPSDGGFTLSRTKKTEIIATEPANMGAECKITRVIFNSSDELLDSKTWLNDSHLTVANDKLDAYITDHKNIITRAFSMKVENGNVIFTEK